MVLLLIPFIYSGGEIQIIADPVHLKLFVVIVAIIKIIGRKICGLNVPG